MRDRDYEGCASTEMSRGELALLGDNLDGLLLNLREALGRVRAVADEHLGGEPETAERSAEKQPSPRSSLARLHRAGDEIASTIAELHSQIGRLEKL